MSRIVHFEIHATDPKTLSAFYAKAFGWNFRHIPELDYYLFDNGGEGIGGGMPKRMGPKPAPDAAVSAYVCSLGVESVDAAVKKALGGRRDHRCAEDGDPRGGLAGLHQGPGRQHPGAAPA